MTAPTIYPAIWDPTDGSDYANAPGLRNGAVQNVYTEVTVPASTATSVVAGIMPFRKGARISYASRIDTDDLDTGTDVTLDVGWVYDDNTTYTNDPNGFIAASAIAQTGGIDLFDAVAGFHFIAEADGWVAATTGGGATTTEGDIRAQILVSYDAESVYA